MAPPPLFPGQPPRRVAGRVIAPLIGIVVEAHPAAQTKEGARSFRMHAPVRFAQRALRRRVWHDALRCVRAGRGEKGQPAACSVISLAVKVVISPSPISAGGTCFFTRMHSTSSPANSTVVGKMVIRLPTHWAVSLP